MQIQPAFSNLLIRMNELATSDSNLIVLPDASAPRYPYGEVLACGPDCRDVSVGDKVLFLSANAIGFEDPIEPKYIIPESCVLGKYVEDGKKASRFDPQTGQCEKCDQLPSNCICEGKSA